MKAAEAVRQWLRNQLCRPCMFGRGEHDPCAGCPALRLDANASNLARAVLGAAGIEQADRTCATCKWWERECQEHDPKTGWGLWWGSCHVTSERVEVDADLDCWVELRTREDFGCVCWAARQRTEGGDRVE